METRVNAALRCARAVHEATARAFRTSDRSPATRGRHADTETPAGDTRAWIRNIATAAVIGTLGIAIAGAVSTAGTASPKDAAPRPVVQVSVDTTVRQPTEFSHRSDRTTRDAERGALVDRNTALERNRQAIEQARADAAARERNKKLGQTAEEARKAAEELASNVPSRMPLGNYALRARWGEYGVWARWHTGVDLGAPLGTPIVAPAAGVVIHAGSGGGAGSWAGCYVVIRHNDGKSSLYAHMNCSIPVSVGQSVAPGTQLGVVGLTGRTFGAHLHMELYPAGVAYGDIYSTIDPLPWLGQGR